MSRTKAASDAHRPKTRRRKLIAAECKSPSTILHPVRSRGRSECRRHAGRGPYAYRILAMPKSSRARAGSTGERPIERANAAARETRGELPSASTPFDK